MRKRLSVILVLLAVGITLELEIVESPPAEACAECVFTECFGREEDGPARCEFDCTPGIGCTCATVGYCEYVCVGGGCGGGDEQPPFPEKPAPPPDIA